MMRRPAIDKPCSSVNYTCLDCGGLHCFCFSLPHEKDEQSAREFHASLVQLGVNINEGYCGFKDRYAWALAYSIWDAARLKYQNKGN